MQFRYDTLIRLINENNLKVGAEIGVKRGENVTKVLTACPDFVFHAIDCWDPKLQYINWTKGAQVVNEQFFNRKLRHFPGRLIKHKGYSVPVSDEFENESLDLIFIDGDHEYIGCVADIIAWLPKLKFGGFLCGHDYGHPRFPGVKQAVDEYLPAVEVFGDMTWVFKKESKDEVAEEKI